MIGHVHGVVFILIHDQYVLEDNPHSLSETSNTYHNTICLRLRLLRSAFRRVQALSLPAPTSTTPYGPQAAI